MGEATVEGCSGWKISKVNAGMHFFQVDTGITLLIIFFFFNLIYLVIIFYDND